MVLSCRSSSGDHSAREVSYASRDRRDPTALDASLSPLSSSVRCQLRHKSTDGVTTRGIGLNVRASDREIKRAEDKYRQRRTGFKKKEEISLGE